MQISRTLPRFLAAIAAASMLMFSTAHAQDASADAAAGQPSKVDLLDFLETDHILGNEDAAVKVIEYASLSCSHCMRFHTQTFPQLKKDYIDTGKIAFVFRHFPLNEPALRGAMLAECSGDERFYNYLKVLFDTQPEWAYDADFLNGLRTLAKVGGVGDEAFDACMANKKLEDSLVSGLKHAASELLIQSTPTLFINGEKVEGFRSYEEVSAIIDAELKEDAQ